MSLFQDIKELIGKEGVLLEVEKSTYVQKALVGWIARATEDKKVMDEIIKFPDIHYELSKNPNLPVELLVALDPKKVDLNSLIRKDTPIEILDKVFVMTIQKIVEINDQNKRVGKRGYKSSPDKEVSRAISLQDRVSYGIVIQAINELTKEGVNLTKEGVNLAMTLTKMTKDIRVLEECILIEKLDSYTLDNPIVTKEMVEKIKSRLDINTSCSTILREIEKGNYTSEEIRDLYYKIKETYRTYNDSSDEISDRKCRLVEAWVDSGLVIPKDVQTDMIWLNNKARATIAPVVSHIDLLEELERETKITVKRKFAKNKNMSNKCHTKYLKIDDMELQLSLLTNELTDPDQIERILKYYLKDYPNKGELLPIKELLENKNCRTRHIKYVILTISRFADAELVMRRYGKEFGKEIYKKVSNICGKEETSKIFDMLSIEDQAIISMKVI